MDKEEYQTYEYLPTAVNTTEPEQYFIMQDDGTFLGVNKEYVAQTDPVYDIPQQIYYLNIEPNPELINVPDQLVLPDSNNYYGCNIVFQNGNVGNTSETQENVVDEINTSCLETEAKTTAEGLTEITLSDEQYQRLQNKGWLLLDENDKTYLLDSLGLHDITSNTKLIEQLRREIDEVNVSSEDTNIVTSSVEDHRVDDTNNFDCKLDPDEKEYHMNEITENVDTKSQLNEKIEEEDEIEVDDSGNHCDTNAENDDGDIKLKINENNTDTNLQINENKCDSLQANENVLSSLRNDCNNFKRVVKLKTSFVFKDVPDKILLGKSANGKNIYAKLRQEPKVHAEQAKLTLSNAVVSDSALGVAIITKLQSGLNADQDSLTAERIVRQLMKMSTFKSTITNKDLLITMSRQNSETSCPTVIMTGQIITKWSNWFLNPVPEIMLKILNKSASDNEEDAENRESSYIIHIHAVDSKQPDGTLKTSIIVNKRPIPIQIEHLKSKNLKKILKYGCGRCAAVFSNINDLEVHRETCIDSSKNSRADQESQETDIIEISEENECIENNEIYKCSMCTSCFRYAATLSRHIVKCHISSKNYTKPVP